MALCSGRGSLRDGECACDRTYYGNRCQYKNECEDDSDCSGNGLCLDIEATTAPRKRCFCQMGFYGEKCDQESRLQARSNQARQEIYLQSRACLEM